MRNYKRAAFLLATITTVLSCTSKLQVSHRTSETEPLSETVQLESALNIAYPIQELSLKVKKPITPQVPATNSKEPLLYSVIPALPRGLVIDPLNGTISGTPEEASDGSLYEISASVNQKTAKTALMISVEPADSQLEKITPSSPPNFRIGRINDKTYIVHWENSFSDSEVEQYELQICNSNTCESNFKVFQTHPINIGNIEVITEESIADKRLFFRFAKKDSSAVSDIYSKKLEVTRIPEGYLSISSSIFQLCYIDKNQDTFCRISANKASNTYGLGKYGVTNNFEKIPFSKATKVYTGYNKICVKTSSGELECLGKNDEGELGVGHTLPVSEPTIISGFTNFLDFSGEENGYSCAVKSDGTVWCAGTNTYGQLGDDSTTNRSSFVQVDGGISTATAVVTNRLSTSCALLADQTVKCWGRGNYSALGTNLTAHTSKPDAIVTGLSNVVQLTNDYGGFCALKTDKTVWCWGYNHENKLGVDPANSGVGIPLQVPGVSDVTQITGSHITTCALQSTGAVQCWGNGDIYGLGDGTYNNDGVVTNVNLPQIVQIESASTAFFAISANRSIYSWGSSPLTSGFAGNSWLVPSWSKEFEEFTSGVYSSCARTADGKVFCKGLNIYGEVGQDLSVEKVSTYKDIGLSGASKIFQTYYSSCAYIDSDIWCWGRDVWGVFGNSTTTTSTTSTPIKTASLPNVIQFAAAPYGVCALLANKSVSCWGRNNGGQIGNNTTALQGSPLTVAGLTDIEEIAAGEYHFCALKSDGKVYCWGLNTSGQVGENTFTDQHVPFLVTGLPPINKIAIKRNTSCGIDDDDSLWCWGSNSYNILSDDIALEKSATPIKVAGLPKIKEIGINLYNACALDFKDSLYCWGYPDISLFSKNQLEEPFIKPTKIKELRNVDSLTSTFVDFHIKLKNEDDVVAGRTLPKHQGISLKSYLMLHEVE